MRFYCNYTTDRLISLQSICGWALAGLAGGTVVCAIITTFLNPHFVLISIFLGCLTWLAQVTRQDVTDQITRKQRTEKEKDQAEKKQRKIPANDAEQIIGLLRTSRRANAGKVLILYASAEKEVANITNQIRDIFSSAGYFVETGSLLSMCPPTTGISISTPSGCPNRFLFIALDTILKAVGQVDNSIECVCAPEQEIEIKIIVYAKP
jgi:hypothetical protein